jgi:hypothetical protein
MSRAVDEPRRVRREKKEFIDPGRARLPDRLFSERRADACISRLFIDH